MGNFRAKFVAFVTVAEEWNEMNSTAINFEEICEKIFSDVLKVLSLEIAVIIITMVDSIFCFKDCV